MLRIVSNIIKELIDSMKAVLASNSTPPRSELTFSVMLVSDLPQHIRVAFIRTIIRMVLFQGAMKQMMGRIAMN